jgi:hypothetical protein
MKNEYIVNDIVELYSGQIILIVGTTEIPYQSPLFRKDEYPENGYDFIVLLKSNNTSKDEFEGKDCIKQNQIKSFIKNLDFD